MKRVKMFLKVFCSRSSIREVEKSHRGLMVLLNDGEETSQKGLYKYIGDRRAKWNIPFYV